MAALPEIARQFIVFCGVGVINTVFSLAIILGLVQAGMNYMLANAIGYGLGLCLGFVLHKRISFCDRSAAYFGQFRSFLSVFAVAYGVQFAALVLMVDRLGFHEMPAQIVACGIYTIINYGGNRVLTFKAAGKNG